MKTQNTTSRTETRESLHGGRIYRIGDRFRICKYFGTPDTEKIVSIKSISPSGKYFKVDGVTTRLFSIETLRSFDSHQFSGFYLTKID